MFCLYSRVIDVILDEKIEDRVGSKGTHNTFYLIA